VKIKKSNAKPSKIKIPEENLIDVDYPVFCFRHLQTKPEKDFKFYADFILRLQQICTLTWKQIGVTHKHGFGTEQMPIARIKPATPLFVTPDVSSLMVFRANGDNRPFLGLRKGNVFHVIFLEEKFNDIYNH